MTEEYVPTPPKSGDLCRLLPDYQVEHYRCDEHRDGTITDSRTGKVIVEAHWSKPKGFRRA